MKTTLATPRGTTRATVVQTLAMIAACAFASPVVADEPAQFDSPEAAVKALQEAAKSGEKGALGKIFGSAAGELLSGDEIQDKADLAEFAKALAAATRLAKNDNGTMTLYIGKNNHPFAIPLAEKGGKWFFDTVAGKEEVLNRRIGENELSTIAVCRAYVVAQREYFQKDRDGDEVLEYAQRLASTPGQKDGLFWEAADGEEESPLGPLMAQARSEGYRQGGTADGKPEPYHGYLFRILNKQGAKAPGGAYDYVINGNMVAGFALVAYPVEHGKSGIMTFIVGPNGKVYEKDLGPKTSEAVAALDAFNPDETWAIEEG